MPTRRADATVLDGRSEGAPRTGLILTGGGARAAYQVGVLQALLDILDTPRRPDFRNPFDILCGTSAGALNATAYACRADRPHVAVARMRRLWSRLHTGMVYRADAPGLIRTGGRWLGLLALGWMFAGRRGPRPRSLLDNAPLADLLAQVLDFDRLSEQLTKHTLKALAITASGYTSGQHLTFYQSAETIQPWQRALRRAVPTTIGVDHLMASSAIPFVFPAQAVDVFGQTEWCGDGSMRQLAPISPAIHMGADRVVVIGTAHRDDTHPEDRHQAPPYPTLAQISGHALANIFIDSVSTDVESVRRVNALIDGGHMGRDSGLRSVAVLALGPSESLDTLALSYLDDMPREVRALLRALGMGVAPGRREGGTLMSYLLFEARYTRRLIELGYADTMRQTEAVIGFFKEAPV